MADSELLARVAKLEARIEELENEREIRELLARYGFNADCCRDDEYIELYTENGAIDLTTGGGGIRRWQGKDELRKFISDPNAHHAPGFYGHAMHMQGNNVVIKIEDGEAVVNSYSIVLQGDGTSAPVFFSAGNNQWRMRKVDGRWLIEERRRRHIGDDRYIHNLDGTPE